jgi:hypothetical protein
LSLLVKEDKPMNIYLSRTYTENFTLPIISKNILTVAI